MLWAAAWIYRASRQSYYSDYVLKNLHKLDPPYSKGSMLEFGWDSKHAGINILVSKASFKLIINCILLHRFILYDFESLIWFCCCAQLGIADHLKPNPFMVNADKFICSVLPDSPTKSVSYSPGRMYIH